MRPTFGNARDIEKAREGKEKARHANCSACEGTLIRAVTCEECCGSGEIEIVCEDPT